MPILNPRTNITIAGSPDLVQSPSHRALIIGQKSQAGTSTSGAIISNFFGEESDIDQSFGARSPLAAMVRAFRDTNQASTMDVIPLDDADTAVSATAEITFAGTATGNQRLMFEIVSARNGRFVVDVSTGDSADSIATRLAAQIAQNTTAPYTSAAASGVVTLTAGNGGTHANSWSIRVQGSVPGITVTLTGWTGGAVDPDLAKLFDDVGSVQFKTVAWPSYFDTSVIKTFLDSRFNVSDAVLDGVGIIVQQGSADSITAAARALNSRSLVVIGDMSITRPDFIGSALMESPDVVSAAVASVRALRLTDDAAVGNILSTTAPLDQFGGLAAASLPYHNTIVPAISPTRPSDEWSAGQVTDFENNGVSVIGPDAAFSRTILGRIVTTEVSDAQGNINVSFQNLNTVDQTTIIRGYVFTRIRARYGQSRLTSGDLNPGRDLANKFEIESFLDQLYQELAGLSITESGGNAIRDFRENRLVTVDVAAGRVSISMRPLLVGQIRAIVGTINVNFDAG